MIVPLRIVNSPRLMSPGGGFQLDRARPSGVRTIVDHCGSSPSFHSPRGRHGPLTAGPAHPRDDQRHITQGPRHDSDGWWSTRSSVWLTSVSSGVKSARFNDTLWAWWLLKTSRGWRGLQESPFPSLFPKYWNLRCWLFLVRFEMSVALRSETHFTAQLIFEAKWTRTICLGSVYVFGAEMRCVEDPKLGSFLLMFFERVLVSYSKSIDICETILITYRNMPSHWSLTWRTSTVCLDPSRNGDAFFVKVLR